jgi:hypothetical protein
MRSECGVCRSSFRILLTWKRSLGRPQAEVRDDDAHLLAADLEIDVERVARLAPGIGEASGAAPPAPCAA